MINVSKTCDVCLARRSIPRYLVYCFIPRYPNEPFLFFFLFPTNFDPMEYSTKKNGKTEDGGNPGIFITRQTDR